MSAQNKYSVLSRRLDESSLRLWAAAEAMSLGRGGVTKVARESGLSRTTIYAGLAELERDPDRLGKLRFGNASGRMPGGGRKPHFEKDQGLLPDLEELLDRSLRGLPVSPLRWTDMSTTELAAELGKRGHRVSQRTVCALLEKMGYLRNSTRKARRNIRHPDRGAQFAYVAQAVMKYLRFDEPVVALDMQCQRGSVAPGRIEDASAVERTEWAYVRHFPDGCPAGQAGRAEDVGAGGPWVPEVIDFQTINQAVGTLRRWWLEFGQASYPRADRLLLALSHGGLSPEQLRFWQVELRRVVDEFRLQVQVCHLPPGTYRWSHIKHRMYSRVLNSWPGRPLVLHQAQIDVVRGFSDASVLGGGDGRFDGEFGAALLPEDSAAAASARGDGFHGEWNYRLVPHDRYEATKKRSVYFY